MNSFEAERKTARDLKDILGWSEDPLNDLVPVCMALCDKIDKLEREIAKLKDATKSPQRSEGGY